MWIPILKGLKHLNTVLCSYYGLHTRITLKGCCLPAHNAAVVAPNPPQPCYCIPCTNKNGRLTPSRNLTTILLPLTPKAENPPVV